MIRNVTRTLAFGLLVFASAAGGQETAREELRSLDEQVQEIKSDVLSIAAELRRLEERLLFPSNTQLGVFVSLVEGDVFRLDAVQVEIDGALAAHHIYSYREQEALQKGGVQRIHTGNVETGRHTLQVVVSGSRPDGRDFSRSERFSFQKDVEPKLLGITLAAASSGAVSIEVTDW